MAIYSTGDLGIVSNFPRDDDQCCFKAGPLQTVIQHRKIIGFSSRVQEVGTKQNEELVPRWFNDY